jgi:hypothetical protein
MRHHRPFRFRTLVAAMAAGMLGAAPAAWAGPHWPDLSIGLGGTAVVSGDVDGGGFAAWAAGTWAIEGPWSMGIHVFADDMGNRLVQAIRPGTPPVSLGTVEERHRFVYGGGWRMDAGLPLLGRWEPVASATWSYARIQDDARGTTLDAMSTNGFGVGLAIRRPVLQHSTVGVALRYHHLFNDTVDGYMSAGVEWGWRFGKTP